jgi:hypothetical protein
MAITTTRRIVITALALLVTTAMFVVCVAKLSSVSHAPVATAHVAAAPASGSASDDSGPGNTVWG